MRLRPTRAVRPLLAFGVLLGLAGPAKAAEISLFQALFRLEGDFTFNVDLSGWDATSTALTFLPPPDADFSEFESDGTNTGLGVIVIEILPNFVSGSGSGSFAAFFDLEVDEATNTFFNESGESSGSTGGVNPTSFEIDEPGFSFGDIFDNFLGNTLDDSTGVPAGSEDDVSVALSWDFTLSSFETAVLTIVISDTGAIALTSTFSVVQTDPDSSASVTYSGALSITGSP
ncbi:MAG: hypothetical protein HY721_02120, partial [Planctomycetes bacterium]|nr:hypothetical protein [Planctomycetota bacterium]